MATVSDYLETARLNAAKRLAELDTVPIEQRARFTHTSSDGITYDWNGYRAALVAELKELTDLIQKNSDAFEILA